MADNPRPKTSETTAFPTFLDTDPFPSTADDRPGTSGTSDTGGTSEFGDNDYTSARERQSNIPSVTGPVGEAGLPPSRPTSVSTGGVSSQRTGARSQAPPSTRRGLAAFAASGRGSLRGSAGGDGENSRPTSAMSRTHVPSLAAPAFFRPMSSQKLQTQRSNRPASGLASTPLRRGSGDEDRSTGPHRYSNASVTTLRDGRVVQDEDVPPVPTSRGTAFTRDGETMGERTTAESVRSAEPLQGKQNQLKLGSNGLPVENSPPNKPPKSPRSLRASFGLGSRRGSSRVNSRIEPSHGHEKLDSTPPSPVNRQDPEKQLPDLPGETPALGRNHEYSASNHLFFLSGRLLNTRAKPLSIATFILTVLPSALFFGFSSPWLWLHVSPAIPLIFAYVFLLTASSFLHASFSDPGILPRNLHPHPPDRSDVDPLAPGPPTTEWVTVKTSLPVKGSTAGNGLPDSGATAMEVPTKYCKSCNIWRPPRAHHCRVCDACIETQDHHCVWLNNCVGRRNYRYFFSYIATGTLLALLLIAFSLTHVGTYGKQNGISFGASLSGRSQERVGFAMFIYAMLALPYPGSLLIYHLFLISRGETTREYLNSHKFPKKDRHRPFSQASILRNLTSVLVRPRPPSYMTFASPHRAGDLRYGHTKRKAERARENKEKYSLGSEKKSTNGGGKKDVEMKQLPAMSAMKKLTARGAGNSGAAAPVNSTPR